MAKTNPNIENDRMYRAGIKAVQASVKLKRANQEKLKDSDTKAALMDYIFGGNTESTSPLA